MGGSRKHKVVERMIKADLDAWAILYRLAYLVPLSQLERAYDEAVALSSGFTFIKKEVVYGIRTDKELSQ